MSAVTSVLCVILVEYSTIKQVCLHWSACIPSTCFYWIYQQNFCCCFLFLKYVEFCVPDMLSFLLSCSGQQEVSSCLLPLVTIFSNNKILYFVLSFVLKNQHSIGEGGFSCGTVGFLQCLVGQHPYQPCCASPRGDICSAAPKSQALHGGPALRHGQWHWAYGTWLYTIIQIFLF